MPVTETSSLRAEWQQSPRSRPWEWVRRMSASLIGFLGQARFPSFFWVIVTHPGHASLRSLVDAVLASLHAYVGSDVESLALRRASFGAADIFGFFYYQIGHVYMPERARTSSGEGRPRQVWWWRFISCRASHLILTEFRAIDPHPVEKDGEFSCDSHNGAATPFSPYQPHAP